MGVQSFPRFGSVGHRVTVFVKNSGRVDEGSFFAMDDGRVLEWYQGIRYLEDHPS